jgi:hypothetical protein
MDQDLRGPPPQTTVVPPPVVTAIVPTPTDPRAPPAFNLGET